MNDAEQVLTPAQTEPGEVGLVTPQDFVSNEPFTFDSGQVLPGFTLRYETYGRLNAARDNVVVVCHALSGDHHCAGIHTLNDRKPGWWNNLIGPGKAVDTNRFFVLCANCLGGCQGSTGPSSINPATGRAYGITFPFVTIRDMVRAQKRLLDSLGIPSIYAVVGGSMGGMQVLQWGIEYPAFVKRLLPMATTSRESAQAIGFNEVGRQAIMQDPGWNHGDYPRNGGPRIGLAIARMMAHITYLSDASMDRKFGRRRYARGQKGETRNPQPEAGGLKADEVNQIVENAAKSGASTVQPLNSISQLSTLNSQPSVGSYSFDVQFEVESYLRYQGESFINRFDANTYLYITRAIDHFDLAAAYGSLEQAFAAVQAETLVIGFTSDWLFPPEQNRAITLALLRAGKRASYAELSTDLGHDSFLLESEQLYTLVRNFLR